MRQHVSKAKPLLSPSSSNTSGLGSAQAFLWFTLFVFLVTIIVGLGWDRRWHVTHTFETFYSPPHLFIYAMSTFATLLVGVMVFSPGLRRRFGPGFRLFPFPFEVPGALVILGGGFVLQGFAGLVLDNFWHSNFGLDETRWSFPHAMLGWTFFITMLGFVAGRLALRPYRPLPWYTVMFLGLLVLGFSAAPFLGPLYGNNSPERVRAIASIPVLLNQTSAQHAFRIYLDWNLTRTNPLFLLLSPVWAGAMLALVRGLDKRARVFLTLSCLWWLLALLGGLRDVLGLDRFLQLFLVKDPASWLPPPIFPAALVFVIMLGLGLSEPWAWALAGWGFGFLVLVIWKAHPFGLVLTLLAGPAMVVGSLIGKVIYRVLEKPAQGAIGGFLMLAGIGMPFVTGLVDLYLRRHTP